MTTTKPLRYQIRPELRNIPACLPHEFSTALEAVLSGQFELCIPSKDESDGDEDFSKAFIRNAKFKQPDGTFNSTYCLSVTKDEALEIIQHHCINHGLKGVISHYYTRTWPASP